MRLLGLFLLLYGVVSAQCHTDSFTVDNFGDHVSIIVPHTALPVCDYVYCVRCDSGSFVGMPPFVQEFSVVSDPANIHIWLIDGCDSVYMDTCVFVSNQSPFRVVVDNTTNDFGLRMCYGSSTRLYVRSVPFLMQPPVYQYMFSFSYMCNGIITPPAKRKKYKFQ